MHPGGSVGGDVRALIHLLDAARDGTRATPGWLGEQLRLNSAGTTALIDRLERLGLIRRSRDTVDRRRALLTVEDKARGLGWAFFEPVISEVTSVAQEFDAGELDTVRRFLTAVPQSTGTHADRAR
ncbi:MarR family winged helix-turn-helix transcriptional regulator [Streptomyces sp. NPDC016845]|uniref:MarR family winged helix-turn-helix transcriptional regulator n=1 Tax=Streptomyces sp. NPDC016845 TaxID=3364972 RepID=UPI00378C794B